MNLISVYHCHLGAGSYPPYDSLSASSNPSYKELMAVQEIQGACPRRCFRGETRHGFSFSPTMHSTWCTIPGSYINSWIQTPAPRFIIHVNCFRGILLRVNSDNTGFIYQFSWATVSSYSSKQSKWCSKRHFVDMIKVHTCMHTQSIWSCPTFFAALWTIAHQAPLSMGFSR